MNVRTEKKNENFLASKNSRTFDESFPALNNNYKITYTRLYTDYGD